MLRKSLISLCPSSCSAPCWPGRRKPPPPRTARSASSTRRARTSTSTPRPRRRTERLHARQYYRQKTYAPYFDSRTSWYGGAWAYKDLTRPTRSTTTPPCATTGSSRTRAATACSSPGAARAAPARSTRPTSPTPHSGPLDRGNPRDLGKVTSGVFIDDVNMEFRVATERQGGPPVDPRTGQAMTARRLAPLRGRLRDPDPRRPFPGMEIAHNPIWYAGHAIPTPPARCRPPTGSTSSAACPTRASPPARPSDRDPARPHRLAARPRQGRPVRRLHRRPGRRRVQHGHLLPDQRHPRRPAHQLRPHPGELVEGLRRQPRRRPRPALPGQRPAAP